jgi:hypothetical protein
MIIVAIEHGFILVRLALAFLIEDIPIKVRDDEYKRVFIQKIANERLAQIKVEGNCMNFLELVAKLNAE